ncbi:MAG: hypothetical protein II383_00140, partial [Bacteroidales bacterium]|nr:hypothetical protein [Bacteroidales bacterium]
MVEIVLDALRTAVLVSGLVVIMMMLIESLHIESHGKWLNGLRASRTGQVLVSALLGSVPGCLGGFASVSLYTHKMLGFGALLAMLIATAGDEAFLMLALFPQRAVLLFAILLVLGIGTGLLM